MTASRTVSCFGCRYFVINHDIRHPYSCQMFGFRTKRLPALDVVASSGKPCTRREAIVRPGGMMPKEGQNERT
jgi:hypothetical protein